MFGSVLLAVVFPLCSSNLISEGYHHAPPAFIASPMPRAISVSALSLAASLYDDGEVAMTFNRRELLTHSAATLLGASSITSRPSIVRAATVAPSSTSASNLALLCDPSVSTWVRSSYNDDNDATARTRMRTVHIMGSAHISSSSAELAGRLVRGLRPDVVFVELDAKRVARANPSGTSVSGSAFIGGSGSGGGGRSDRVYGGDRKSAAEENNGSKPRVMTSVIAAMPSGTSSDIDRPTNPFDVQSRLVNAGAKVVGDTVKSMYTKLESEGFKAGDEFATSVREGLAIGSTIVLGDRDVEVTLRRLTRALTKTDIRKLLSPDSDIERSMEGLLPEGMKKSLEQSGNGGGGGNGSMTSGVDALVSKEDLNTFIETMKAKDNIKKIMSALRTTAPEIYEAMVAERDVYMGQGLDELDLNLAGGGSVESTVAVVGMAHVDGIERYLASKGWIAKSYPCPMMR